MKHLVPAEKRKKDQNTDRRLAKLLEVPEDYIRKFWDPKIVGAIEAFDHEVHFQAEQKRLKKAGSEAGGSRASALRKLLSRIKGDESSG